MKLVINNKTTHNKYFVLKTYTVFTLDNIK